MTWRGNWLILSPGFAAPLCFSLLALAPYFTPVAAADNSFIPSALAEETQAASAIDMAWINARLEEADALDSRQQYQQAEAIYLDAMQRIDSSGGDKAPRMAGYILAKSGLRESELKKAGASYRPGAEYYRVASELALKYSDFSNIVDDDYPLKYLQILVESGDVAGQEAQLSRLFEKARQAWGDEAIATQGYALHLATLLFGQDRLDEALDLLNGRAAFLKADTVTEKKLFLRYTVLFSNILFRQKHYQQVVDVLQPGLYASDLLPADQKLGEWFYRADAKYILSNAWWYLGQYEKSYNAAFGAMAAVIRPEASPDFDFSVRLNYAWILFDRGEFSLAQLRFCELHEAARKDFGDTDARTILVKSWCARADLAFGGNIITGETMLRDAALDARQHLPLDDVRTLTVLRNYGLRLMETDQLEQAENILQLLIERSDKAYEKDDYRIYRHRLDMANLLKEKGEYQKAMTEMAFAITGLKKTLPADHPIVLLARADQLKLKYATGNIDEPLAQYPRLLEQLDQKLIFRYGSYVLNRHARYLAVSHDYGELLLQEGQYRTAELHFRRQIWLSYRVNPFRPRMDDSFTLARALLAQPGREHLAVYLTNDWLYVLQGRREYLGSKAKFASRLEHELEISSEHFILHAEASWHARQYLCEHVPADYDPDMYRSMYDCE